jgi:FkbM family methyltransferase
VERSKFELPLFIKSKLFQLSVSTKSLLLRTIGSNRTAWIHAFRFLKVSRSIREPELLLIPQYLKDGDWGVDVGANGGDWSYRMSRAVGRTGKVLAFEADPYYALVTSRCLNLQRLRNISLYPFGLSDQEVTTRLVIDIGDGQRTSGLSFIDVNADSEKSVAVELKMFDAVVSRENIDVSRLRLFKVDVEGHEEEVLRGAQKAIAAARPIIIAEVSSPAANLKNQGPAPVVKLLRGWDYLPFAYLEGQLVPYTEDSGVFNVVFHPSELVQKLSPQT